MWAVESMRSRREPGVGRVGSAYSPDNSSKSVFGVQSQRLHPDDPFDSHLLVL